MRYFLFITYNVSIGIILMIFGMNTVQSLYFAGMLSSFTCWGLIILLETKKANTEGNQ